MNALVDLVIFVAATAIVIKGAGWLVDAVSRLAKKLGISEIVLGLTVVAFGTSLPELGVSFMAAVERHSDISIGNVIGSNIFNLGFILGMSALLRPMATSRIIVFRDGFILLGITLLLLLVIVDLQISRWEGMLFLFGLAGYLVVLFKQRHVAGVNEVEHEEQPRTWDWLWVLVGLAALMTGSHFAVYSAARIARDLGLSEWTIGVTIVAAGTSMPEVITSVVAARKGRYDISIGNIIGSDIFNQLGIIGISASIVPMAVAPGALISVGALIATVALVVLMMRTGYQLTRREGLILFLLAMTRMGYDLFF
ncbi:MAG: calcium/sodium antiporter [candidate division KSB1 bacterium]|nr:calcium/sodium antiporter [candidate division KSB1 bacterium]MDZ7302486.1 calcium/sodium antiporter [candidate division KSB1 bacterium]MDZ7311919.1 calcium/sodium antiporter [candidate division KSB1 bacterium]